MATYEFRCCGITQEITVSIDYGYEGAGYAFTLDLEGLIKKLNK